MKKKIGFAITGSFCTFNAILVQLKKIKDTYDIFPIMSYNAANIDTRFYKSKDFIKEVEKITEENIIYKIEEAEPIGPKKLLDLLLIAPCTGNTVAKLANGISDTSVTLAAKAHLRNNKPLVIAISSNDGLGANAHNIGVLINTKNIYFVPFGQDDHLNKIKSLVADFNLIPETIELAFKNMQIQPVMIKKMQQ